VALQQSPGNDFPNFRLAKEKTKLDELAASLEEECLIPEISFGIEEIKNTKKVCSMKGGGLSNTRDQMDNC